MMPRSFKEISTRWWVAKGEGKCGAQSSCSAWCIQKEAHRIFEWGYGPFFISVVWCSSYKKSVISGLNK